MAAFLRARFAPTEEERLHWKLEFVRRVLRCRDGRTLLQFLFRMLNHLIELEGDMKRRFDRAMEAEIEEEPIELWSDMEWEAMTRGKKEGKKEGNVEGRRELLLRVLRARFRIVPRAIRAAIQGIEDSRRLDRLAEKAAVAETVAVISAALARRAPPSRTPLPRSRGRRGRSTPARE